jgi:uncharacterized protein with PQ loop repeat
MEWDWPNLFRINSTIAALLISAGIYVQCFRVFRTRSAGDFSPALVIALLYFEVSWLIYGLAIMEWPVIAMTVVTLPADIGIAAGYLLYGRPRMPG